jgi:hypothetical protein
MCDITGPAHICTTAFMVLVGIQTEHQICSGPHFLSKVGLLRVDSQEMVKKCSDSRNGTVILPIKKVVYFSDRILWPKSLEVHCR